MKMYSELVKLKEICEFKHSSANKSMISKVIIISVCEMLEIIIIHQKSQPFEKDTSLSSC